MREKALKDLKIGIIGVGMVGGAMKRYFESKGIKPFLYDKGKNLGSWEEINQADVVFICVPTPFDPPAPRGQDKGFDLSCVQEACQNLTGQKIVVIKSTVLPGTTEKLQEQYPQHKFLFNPEFLVEEKADEGMQNPERQIIGYTEKSREIAGDILNILPWAPFEQIIRAREAEMVKYFGNTFLSTKVIFANQMYQLCQKFDIDYEVVRRCASADSRIGISHLDVHYGGFFGYGGKCFPKDIRALIQLADEKGVDLKLHKIVEEINNQLLKEQGIEDPEKFSKRE